MKRRVLEPGAALTSAEIAAGVAGIDWDAWQPGVRATLCFLRERERILLIRKKRGLGEGKLTGPGGKLEPGESAVACALREMREELGVTPQDAHEVGEFSAQFSDGLATHVAVFAATRWTGTVRESAEAAPHWVATDAIPYAEMWPDNALWLPELIAGRRFAARLVLDYERLLDSELLR